MPSAGDELFEHSQQASDTYTSPSSFPLKEMSKPHSTTMPSPLKTRKLFTFLTQTFIENIALRPNSHLLLTTFRQAELYTLNPHTPSPEPHLIARLPGVNALTGLAQIRPDVWAIAGGNHAPEPFVFEKGTMRVFTVDLSSGVEDVVIETVAEVPGAPLLNGMSNIPQNPHVLLSVDSHGKVWRIDAKTGRVDVVLENETLMPSEEFPLGANGAKVFEGWLYWTNSARGTFCRVPIDELGNVTGDVEIVARNAGVGANVAYDDFDFDRTTGTAYLTQHPDSVHKVNKDGTLEIFAGGSYDIFQEPTSLVVSADGRSMYVACPGRMGQWLGNIVEVEIPCDE